jgi:hypothetical protein
MVRPAEALIDAHVFFSTRSVANERLIQHAHLGILTSYAYKQVSTDESSREQVILSKFEKADQIWITMSAIYSGMVRVLKGCLV